MDMRSTNRPGDDASPSDASSDADTRTRVLAARQQALQWVRRLQSLPLPGTDADRPRLYYVLSPGAPDAWPRSERLRVYRMRPLEGGALSHPEDYPSLREQSHAPPAFWEEIDAQVASALAREAFVPGEGLTLNGQRAREALVAIAAAGRLYLDTPPRRSDEPSLRPGERRPGRMTWRHEPDPADPRRGEPMLRLGLDVAAPAVPLYTAEPAWIDRAARLIGPLTVDAPPPLLAWLRDAPAIPAAAAADVATALQVQLLARPALRDRIPDLPGQAVRELRLPPVPVLGLFATSPVATRLPSRRPRSGREYLVVSLAVDYEGQRIEPLRAGTLALQTDEGPVLMVCDPDAERAALNRLREALEQLAGREAGIVFARDRAPGGGARSGWLTVATVPADGVAATRIKHELAPLLQADGWVLSDHAELPTALLAADALLVGLKEATGAAGGDWFDVQTGIAVGDRRVDLAPVLADIVAAGGYDAWYRTHCPQGVLWMKVSETEVLRLDAVRIEPLARVVAAWAEPRADDEAEPPDGPRIGRFGAAQLAALTGAPAPESVGRLRRWFDAFDGLKPVEPPATFLSALRPYQRDGLAWLRFIADGSAGGILADDMGLGKTVQLLAHIETERAAGRLDAPVLVVSPTSVVFNWQAEAARHAPRLRLLALIGPDRARHVEAVGRHDIVLTTYALLPRDAQALAAIRWHLVVIDEAQWIKNAKTQAAAALRGLRAGHRIALTGTPLENHLGELWSIMNFAMPGLLGTEESFRTGFRQPIEKRTDAAVAEERLRALERRIRPFVLRRTKEGVLADLPPRTEIVQRIELPAEQRDFYESIRAAMDKRVREALAGAGLGRSRIVLLDALLKLRQACCDPSLVRLPGAKQVNRSAKRDALIELLATLADEGRKALVFSQFTKMLDLIEIAIDADPRLAGLTRSRLDGETVDRAAAVERFQQGDAQILLLSLKAGGVGLNLTAADTVIHYDPWWNPAVEHQATDRAHRIGQQNPVFVYKLIAAGTIEERILTLQSRKAELAEAVLTGSLSGAGAALTQEDLLSLLEGL